MIIRISRSGSSFTGAGKYYLHDKAADKSVANHLKPKTDERVWFTDIRNCFSTEPEKALIEMWCTADDQAFLKRQANGRTSGRACTNPCKTLSLSWHKDDTPEPAHMVQAADAYLKSMGWQDHQAVYIGHRDTEHLHIHIVLNRVHPEHGRTLDDFKDKVRSQAWGLAYEQEQGKVRCDNRELNAALRGDKALPERHRANIPEPEKQPTPANAPKPRGEPANTHLPHNVIMMTRPMQQSFEASEKSCADLDALERDLLKQKQREEREAYFKEAPKLFNTARHDAYDAVRETYKPEWREYYKEEGAAQKGADAFSKNAVSRALYFAKDGRFAEARDAISNKDSVINDVREIFAARKADLKSRQAEEARERQTTACDALRENREADYKDLLQRQRDERAGLTAAHAMGERASDLVAQTFTAKTANQNENPNAKAIEPANANPVPGNDAGLKTGTAHELLFPTPSVEKAEDKTAFSDIEPNLQPSPSLDLPNTKGVTGAADLAAGGIGAAATYLSDQLGELFAPTPPEVRAARALHEAKREAEKPLPEPSPENAWVKYTDAAMRIAEQERETRSSSEYWKERDRSKGFERDG